MIAMLLYLGIMTILGAVLGYCVHAPTWRLMVVGWGSAIVLALVMSPWLFPLP